MPKVLKTIKVLVIRKEGQEDLYITDELDWYPSDCSFMLNHMVMPHKHRYQLKLVDWDRSYNMLDFHERIDFVTDFVKGWRIFINDPDEKAKWHKYFNQLWERGVSYW